MRWVLAYLKLDSFPKLLGIPTGDFWGSITIKYTFILKPKWNKQKPPKPFCFHEADPKCFHPSQNMRGKENSWEKLPSGGAPRSPSWVPNWPASGVQLPPGYKTGQGGIKSVKVSQRLTGASTRYHNHYLLEHVDALESFFFIAYSSTYLFVWSQFHFEKHRKRARTLHETENASFWTDRIIDLPTFSKILL